MADNRQENRKNTLKLKQKELKQVKGGYRSSEKCPNFKQCGGYIETVGGVTYCSVCGPLN